MNRNLRAAILILVTLAGGAVAGAVLGSLAGTVYLVIVYPVVAAIAVGFIGRAAVAALKLDSPRLASVAGGLSGLMVMAGILVVTYQIERAWVVEELTGKRAVSDATLDRVVDDYMGERTGGVTNWRAPLELRLVSGVAITGGFTLDLGDGLNGVILLLELLSASFLGSRLVRERASEPFCDHCDGWYSRRVIGTAPLGSKASLISELGSDQFHRVGRHLDPPTSRHPLKLHGWFCDTCDKSDVTFELELASPGGRPTLLKARSAPHTALEDIMDSQALKRERSSRT